LGVITVGSLENDLLSENDAAYPRQPLDGSDTGILLCRDLIFTTKVQRTALSLGYHFEVIGDVLNAKARIEAIHPRLVLIDLTATQLCVPAAIGDYAALAGREAWIVAFGPHVEPEALANAKEAGCHVVLTRSKFASELPKLLQFYFSQLPGCS
jgi:hypothetical protein